MSTSSHRSLVKGGPREGTNTQCVWPAVCMGRVGPGHHTEPSAEEADASRHWRLEVTSVYMQCQGPRRLQAGHHSICYSVWSHPLALWTNFLFPTHQSPEETFPESSRRNTCVTPKPNHSTDRCRLLTSLFTLQGLSTHVTGSLHI